VRCAYLVRSEVCMCLETEYSYTGVDERRSYGSEELSVIMAATAAFGKNKRHHRHSVSVAQKPSSGPPLFSTSDSNSEPDSISRGYKCRDTGIL
jgi:hypothetical protein